MSNAGSVLSVLQLAVAAIAAAILGVILITALWPWLKSYALARPDARSSHREPTPQGGGIAVLAATLAIFWAAMLLSPTWQHPATDAFLLLTAVLILLALMERSMMCIHYRRSHASFCNAQGSARWSRCCPMMFAL